jgi:hypothetical protein
MADLIIAIRTGDVKKGGTDFDVDVKLTYSDHSQSNWKTLDNAGDDRERGDLNVYRVDGGSGEVAKLSMRVKHEAAHLNDDVSYDAWYLSWIAVTRTNLSGKQLFYKPNRWVEVAQGDPNWHDVELGNPDLSIPGGVIVEITTAVVGIFG